MKTVPDAQNGEHEDLLERSPSEDRRRQNQPLFGLLLVLTPLLAGVATVQVGPPAGGMVATLMGPLLFLATHVEPFPRTPLGRLMSEDDR